MTRPDANAPLEQQIDMLPGLPRTELLARWRGHYKADPPKGISRALLIRTVAYGMQSRATRGLKPSVRRRLLADEFADKTAAPRRPQLPPGARLLRDWNGSTHAVDVVEDGFLWNGARYRSLSAVARAITGARWSGPRFFGLDRDSNR